MKCYETKLTTWEEKDVLEVNVWRYLRYGLELLFPNTKIIIKDYDGKLLDKVTIKQLNTSYLENTRFSDNNPYPNIEKYRGRTASRIIVENFEGEPEVRTIILRKKEEEEDED